MRLNKILKFAESLSLMHLDEKRQTLTFNLFNKTYNS